MLTVMTWNLENLERPAADAAQTASRTTKVQASNTRPYQSAAFRTPGSTKKYPPPNGCT
jgi:hypothetical protein